MFTRRRREGRSLVNKIEQIKAEKGGLDPHIVCRGALSGPPCGESTPAESARRRGAGRTTHRGTAVRSPRRAPVERACLEPGLSVGPRAGSCSDARRPAQPAVDRPTRSRLRSTRGNHAHVDRRAGALAPVAINLPPAHLPTSSKEGRHGKAGDRAGGAPSLRNKPAPANFRRGHLILP